MTRALWVAALLLPCAAMAQNEYYAVQDWRVNCGPNNPFQYYVDARGQHPSTVQMANVQPAVEAAYQTWQDVGCSYVAFASQGLSTTNAQIVDARDPYDTFNVTAIWIKSASDPYYGYALGGGAAAAASIPLTYGGNVYQCDIYLNAVDYTWATITPTPAGAVDVQTFILHEIGHCLGLGHSENWDDVMWGGSYYGVQRRVLTSRDQQMICQLYPQSGAVGSPCLTDGGCASGSAGPQLTCVKPPLPDGGTAPSLCSKGCDPNGAFECDAPFVCKPSTLVSGSSGACLPTQGDYVTQVGAPCTQNGQCGSAVGLCITEGQLPSGFPAWQGGYCSQACGQGQPSCPAGARCLDLGGSMDCLKTCRLGSGDCRPGYVCANVAQDVNTCVSACHSDSDCGGGGYLCRLCDGTCIASQNPTAQVGDPCTVDGQCGAGQVCLFFDGNTQVGVCSQSCATTCTACPNGSSCHPTQSGDLYCLRDCTPGSCPQGLQCGLLQSGRGCIPGCTDNLQCPVGSVCNNGQCTTPGAYDGGTCTLCGTGDAGNPNPTGGLKPDAGTGGGSGGCGCGSAPGAALMVPFVLALLLMARRRVRSS